VRNVTAHGVVLRRDAVVQEITAEAVRVRIAGGEVETIAADDVIVAAHVQRDTSFADLLAAEGFTVRVAGDADNVGYIEGAIHSAWAIAEEL
jgi:phytoene dehydrogenase-like protein